MALLLTACGGGGGDTGSAPLPVADTTPPTITISGDAEMRVEQGTEFTDPGATARDDTDGEVTVTVSGEVDAKTAGTYTLIYTAVDAPATRLPRNVSLLCRHDCPYCHLNGAGHYA